MSRVDEIKAQLVERSDQTTEEFIEEIIPQTVEMIPEEIVETTSIILAPEEPPVEPPIKDPIMLLRTLRLPNHLQRLFSPILLL